MAKTIKVFISWSGIRSRKIARAIHDWLPYTIQIAEPWMSDDIQPGARWNAELFQRLIEANVCLVCVTPENADSRWLNFEAGAIARSVEESRVVPILYGLSARELGYSNARN
jgi:hypothetical protein